MTTHVHTLHGCSPTPLAHYLKALAVLRLTAEQKDDAARGFWRNGVFHLVTALSRDALLDFFLNDYSPTPLVAPWNGASGFYPKDGKKGINAIGASRAPRFLAYAEAIAIAKELVAGRTERPTDNEKLAMIAQTKRCWDGGAEEWVNAVVVLLGDNARYPALLGTGGNDGHFDFTNNQMQRLTELLDPVTGLPRTGAAETLERSLFGGVYRGLANAAVGQFLPGNAGGENSTAGYSGGSAINRWDFVLMLEGAILFQVAVFRRLAAQDLPQAAAPFAVASGTSGYASASAVDETKGRGEQWMPLWSQPATLAEVRSLFAEGRLQSGKDRARSALDAAKAVARLGAARGVASFSRFGFFERIGKNHLAVSLGEWEVGNDPSAPLLDEIAAWVESLRRAAKGDAAPAGFERSVRAINSAVFDVCRPGTNTARWQRLLRTLADAEDGLVRRGKATVAARLQPLPRLSSGWLKVVDDQSPEVRIALAIASQAAPNRAGSSPIRASCLPLDPRSPWKFAAGASGLANDAGVVWTGRDLVDDLGAIAARRIVDAAKTATSGFPLAGRAYASLDDIATFVEDEGALDLDAIGSLSRGLMAVDWSQAKVAAPAPSVRCSAAFALFRLAYPVAHKGESSICDPVILQLLRAERLEDAAARALQRLTTMGLRPKVRRFAGSGRLARRLAASLAIPISAKDRDRLVYVLCKPRDVAKESSPETEREIP